MFLKKKICCFLFVTAPLIGAAQERLSLQDAIGTALKNNYSIRISANEAEITRNDNTAGRAGMLPVVDGVAELGETQNDLQQTYADGRVVDRKSVNNTVTSAGVQLNWTLFNGMRMFATKSRLSELEARGEVQYRQDLENTVKDVISSYFAVVQIARLLEAIEVNIAIDSERVALAKIRLGTGAGSRLELLQASVDLNEQYSARMKLQVGHREAKDRLNYVMSRSPSVDFVTVDSMVIVYDPKADSLRLSVQQNNPSIRLAQSDQRISLQSLREMRSYYYPQLDAQAGYNFLKNENEAGFLLSNRNTGISYGLSLRWNLFNGMNTRTEVSNARLRNQSSGYFLEDTRLRISTELEKALRDFESNKQMLVLEEENIVLARENLEIAFERFRSGLYTSLQLKDAQSSFQDAEVRLVQVQYATKLAETELMRLNGSLVR